MPTIWQDGSAKPWLTSLPILVLLNRRLLFLTIILIIDEKRAAKRFGIQKDHPPSIRRPPNIVHLEIPFRGARQTSLSVERDGSDALDKQLTHWNADAFRDLAVTSVPCIQPSNTAAHSEEGWLNRIPSHVREGLVVQKYTTEFGLERIGRTRECEDMQSMR